jgi:HEAT repeat protein
VKRELRELAIGRTAQRASSAFALGDMGSQTAVRPLVRALGDAEPEVRVAAALAPSEPSADPATSVAAMSGV